MLRNPKMTMFFFFNCFLNFTDVGMSAIKTLFYQSMLPLFVLAFIYQTTQRVLSLSEDIAKETGPSDERGKKYSGIL